jgi:hypothetical protein
MLSMIRLAFLLTTPTALQIKAVEEASRLGFSELKPLSLRRYLSY